jgi:hypothetical protein
VNGEEEEWFIKFNLLTFATKEFSRPINELTNFFKESYPFLNTYSQLINEDLKVQSPLLRNYCNNSRSNTKDNPIV